jgi:hypothetical protein
MPGLRRSQAENTRPRSSQIDGIPVTGSSFVDGRILDCHILEFAIFEDFAAFQALNKFRILIASDDLHTRVAAFLVHGITHGRHGVALRLW